MSETVKELQDALVREFERNNELRRKLAEIAGINIRMRTAMLEACGAVAVQRFDEVQGVLRRGLEA